MCASFTATRNSLGGRQMALESSTSPLHWGGPVCVGQLGATAQHETAKRETRGAKARPSGADRTDWPPDRVAACFGRPVNSLGAPFVSVSPFGGTKFAPLSSNLFLSRPQTIGRPHFSPSSPSSPNTLARWPTSCQAADWALIARRKAAVCPEANSTG